MRGSQVSQVLPCREAGIIPAGAGLTQCSAPLFPAPWDHPRGCGAHMGTADLRYRGEGSSPRVRGSPQCFMVLLNQVGIIPAGAGLTDSFCHCNSPPWDHPRGCGAHVSGSIPVAVVVGSSPRVRGSLAEREIAMTKNGIIPAGAGLTLKNPNSCTIPYLPKAQNHSLLTILTGYSL